MITLLIATLLTAGPDEPFSGKDLVGWKTKGDAAKSHWKAGKSKLDPDDAKKLTVWDAPGELINATGGGVDIYTEAKWRDALIDVEVMVPKGSNSGIYVMGEYEVQVFDSFGKEKMEASDIGAIYGASVPKVNASLKPGEWQKFMIDFKAPKFNDKGEKTSNAVFVKVVLNGQILHENVEMKGPTPAGVTGKEAAAGPLMFQGDHGPVAYRNIKITPK